MKLLITFQKPLFWNAVCQKYANVLMSLPLKVRSLVFSDLLKLFEDFSKDKNSLNLLKNLPFQEQRKILYSYAEKMSFEKETKNFLETLSYYGHFGFLKEIIKLFQEKIHTEKHQIVYLTCAVLITQKQQSDLKKILFRFLKKPIDLRLTYNPSLLLGGVLIFDRFMLDGSLKNLLKTLKQEISYGKRTSSAF